MGTQFGIRKNKYTYIMLRLGLTKVRIQAANGFVMIIVFDDTDSCSCIFHIVSVTKGNRFNPLLFDVSCALYHGTNYRIASKLSYTENVIA